MNDKSKFLEAANDFVKFGDLDPTHSVRSIHHECPELPLFREHFRGLTRKNYGGS